MQSDCCPRTHDFTALREALALARDPEQHAEIALELALALFAVIRSHEGRVVPEEAWAHEGGLSPETVELLEAALIGGGLDELSATQALLARAAPHFERAARGEVHDPRMLAVLAVVGALTGMHAGDVAALARLALGDGRLLEQWLDDGYVTATYALRATDRLADAAAAMDAGIAEAQRRGLAPMFMQLAVMRAETALRSGDLDTAEVYAEQALELGRELGVEHVALRQWLPIVLIERGHVDAACELVESVELDNLLLVARSLVVLLAHRGRVRIAAGQLALGVTDLLDMDPRMAAARLGSWGRKPIGHRPPHSDWWRSGAVTKPSGLRAESSRRRSRSARRGVMGSRSR